MKNSNKIHISLGIILLVAVLFGIKSYFNNPERLEAQRISKIQESLNNFATTYKKKLPLKLNDEHTLIDIRIGPKLRVDYVYEMDYTLAQYSKALENEEEFNRLYEKPLKNVVHAYCDDKKMETFKNNNVIMHYSYMSKDHKPLFAVEDFDSGICQTRELPKIRIARN